jgi:putative membrane protein
MGFYGTSAGVFSDLSLTLEVMVTMVFLLGFWYGRRHISLMHYKLMTLGFIFDSAFMVSYMVKRLVEGSTKFMGPESIYKLVYLPTVVFHSLISAGVLLLAGYMVYYGFRYTKIAEGKRIFHTPERYFKHRRVGYATLTAWVLSFCSGIAVYLLLYVLY